MDRKQLSIVDAHAHLPIKEYLKSLGIVKAIFRGSTETVDEMILE